jgi:hypothetical protein
MIVFELKCARDHGFESWFADSATFERLRAAGEIACPACGDTGVTKALMTPNVRTGKAPRPASTESPVEADSAAPSSTVPAAAPEPQTAVAMMGGLEKAVEVIQVLRTMRDQVEKNCDYVGPKFAEEARKIHYGEIEHHNIYGETTSDEARDLKEEGVEFGVLPWPNREDA